MNRALSILVILAGDLAAEVVPELRVTSEFSPLGGREILSPAIPRGGVTSFHLKVAGEPGTEFTVYVGQNPENAVRVELWREGTKLTLPYKTRMPEGVTSLTLWLDLWVDRDALVRRIKVEPQLYVHERWVVYPMEMRVVAAQIPEHAPAGPAGSPLVPALLARFCGGPTAPVPRNIAQDFAIAMAKPPADVRDAFAEAVGVQDLASWCKDPKLPEQPEWFLKFRDWLLGQRKLSRVTN